VVLLEADQRLGRSGLGRRAEAASDRPAYRGRDRQNGRDLYRCCVDEPPADTL